ncbi:MAG: hypothetical protein DRO00_03705 [Thermoproteota archaeon]|nr:MAG: hypothetical protein DRN92_05455 [Candidatus Korarchaeota archaeon]RLG53564.1 MAG: hypothetical protein DRO00_03705 [Candidatus Korarchaeota archaeon]
MSSVTISVRIPKELKEKIDKHGIKVSDVVRRALEDEVKRRELEEAAKAAEELSKLFSKIPEQEIIRLIKEYRGSR